MKKLGVLILIQACLATVSAAAQPIKVASWNLGWHVSQGEVPNWIARCGRSFVKDAGDGVWKPVPAGMQGATVGWHIKESRAKLEGVDLSVMPPCGVYQTPARVNVPVTAASFALRSRQLAGFIRDTVNPDVIAFQEVSGTAAVNEALGPMASEFQTCSFDGQYKVQRLAFAWRKSVAEVVEPCRPIDAISLPSMPEVDRVRPGYQVGLKIQGKLVRFLNLHLKSSCVSPLDGGQLDSTDAKVEACALLQQQVRPLEAAIEQLAPGADHFVLLGDFNRNIWHEQNQVAGARAVRSDGSVDLKSPMADSLRTQNLLLEINDGEPSTSQLALLPLTCSGAALDVLCQASKTRKLTQPESRTVASDTGLGCRNGVGLDHMLVSKGLEPRVTQVVKLSIGRLGRSMEPRPDKPEPLLAISDHCPIVATVDMQ